MGDSQIVRLGVAGALGRMGREVLSLAAENAEIEVNAAFDSAGALGRMEGALTLTTPEQALLDCDVIIDFSTAAASTALATAAARRGGPRLIIGSTGFTKADEEAIERASASVAVVKSGNYSLGVAVLTALVGQAARRLAAQDWDIEILDTHHRRKTDAPSGTAIMLGESAARGRGRQLSDIAVGQGEGRVGARTPGSIGFGSLRGGGVIGEHAVIFAGEDEVLTLSHSAGDRRLFARGAIAAALWVRERPPGLYDMNDVLGFRT